MYPKIRLNKNEWWYKFLFIDKSGEVDMYQIKTNFGFQYAESAAWGNCTFNGCNNMKYIGKKKVGG
jgi:hypothetical protein